MSSTRNASYEVYALRYASRDTMASEKYYRYELYAEPDKEYRTDYYFWLARNNERTVLVDCGYSEMSATARNRRVDTHPIDLLARLDVSPADVDHVVLSHMHFDHVGNVGLFPNATFSMARPEFEFWTGPYSDRPCIAWAVQPDEVRAVDELRREGRLYLMDQPTEELFPGIRLTTLPGHTPGQLITEVDAGPEQIVLASDAIHFYDEMRLDRPFQIFTELEGMYRTYERLRNLAARPSTTIIAGHDPEVMTMFDIVHENCADLTAVRPAP